MKQQKAAVVWNRALGDGYAHLALSCKQGFALAAAGQFVMIRMGDGMVPFLRRPFSIAGLVGDPDRPQGIELLVKVVGTGTRLLAQMAEKQSLDLIGPLGHGFRVPAECRRVYFAAGGIGVAPIRFLAAQLVSRGLDPSGCRLFLGGRSRQDLLCRNDFEALGVDVTATTDDGSEGNQCLLTDPLEAAIEKDRPDIVFACGPHGMLSCIAGIVERTRVPCQVSLETFMACGLGACLGCAVRPRDDDGQYLHACVHGPVFNVADIDL